jgi:hypothetical protein
MLSFKNENAEAEVEPKALVACDEDQSRKPEAKKTLDEKADEVNSENDNNGSKNAKQEEIRCTENIMTKEATSSSSIAVAGL